MDERDELLVERIKTAIYGLDERFPDFWNMGYKEFICRVRHYYYSAPVGIYPVFELKTYQGISLELIYYYARAYYGVDDE